MQAHNNRIQDFLGLAKTVFVVPVYQRNYDWKDEQCQKLFDDILNVVKTNQEHFLGTICYKMYDSRERAVIDGQQRITSITLLLKAICDFVHDEDIRSDIKDTYIFNKGVGIDSNFMKTKLHLNKKDDAVYHILLDNNKDTVDDCLTVSQKSSRIYLNYKLFLQLLENFENNVGSSEKIVEALDKLTFIELEIQQENPQEIFESLNSTGLDLTKVDLLRNYFLMQFPHKEQTKLYEDYWSKIEDAIGVERMEQFFVDFLVFKRRSDAITLNGKRNHINENRLYDAFKDYYKNLPCDSDLEKTIKCFKDLKNLAYLYKNLVFSDDINLQIESPIRVKLYYLLNINESTKARSLLLYIFYLHNKGSIDDNMLNEIIDAISSLTFRARICKKQGINRQFAGNVMQRLDTVKDYSSFMDAFWQALTSGKGSYAFPTDAEFIDVLMNKDLYQALRSKGTKYLLYMLELNSKYPKGLPPFDNDTITIEHIMPQTLSPWWQNYLSAETKESYESLLHRLGNLTLTNYNQTMSNKNFEEKKGIYKNSNFFYARQITYYDKWQIEEINDRTQKLANEALKIWKLPTKYQNDQTVLQTLHNLNEDLGQFAYTKPTQLMVGNNEYVVSNWSEILPMVCDALNKDNSDIFDDIATPNKIGVFVISDENKDYSEKKSYSRVKDNLYIKTALSSDSILRTAARIVKSYDDAAGTDFFGNILFTAIPR